MDKCPVCGSDLEHVGKAELTANGHHARKMRCNEKSCPRDIVHVGWAGD